MKEDNQHQPESEYRETDGGTTTEDSVGEVTSDLRTRFRNLVDRASKATLMISSVAALAIGAVGAWATSNWFGLAPLFFLLLGGYSWYYLMQRSNGWISAGTSCYILAVEFFFLAPAYYIPVLFRSSTGEGLESAGTFAGSLLGIIIWGFIFFFVALLLAVAGFLLRRKGSSKKSQKIESVV